MDVDVGELLERLSGMALGTITGKGKRCTCRGRGR